MQIVYIGGKNIHYDIEFDIMTLNYHRGNYDETVFCYLW